jgi:hypothetical protein
MLNSSGQCLELVFREVKKIEVAESTELCRHSGQFVTLQSQFCYIDAPAYRLRQRFKEIAVKKFYDLLKKAFHKKKVRKATKPGKGAIEDRLKAKKALSEKKKGRRGEW